ncbi:sigma-70 family RNA polymerase sigma factor [Lentisphaera profundi]|uniref:RNA polymerase sigma factor SigS n=1 Tax=Lentisphaera profundi TaxID=1658616 RepID=A0ABY7VRU5_9BACT|nr:sigma-70 family RNA polymerase sigma factor [Lentisphaera profundi]WDE96921.1 sigma-70 family RNA polymerase sigma factor [Lentisphaera profundi]
MNSKKSLYTQKTLLLKLRNQYDDDAWQRFIEYYKNYIYVVVKNLGVDKSDLDDVVQAILIKLWSKLPEFEYQPNKGSFRSWLCTVIRFHVYNCFRDNNKYSPLDDEGSIQAEIDSISEREWMLHISQLAWKAITPNFTPQVTNVYIRLSQGDTADHIASDLNISRGSVYVYKERVQKALRREVRRLDNELG